MDLHPLGTLGLSHCQLPWGTNSAGRAPRGTSSARRRFLLPPWSPAAITQLQGGAIHTAMDASVLGLCRVWRTQTHSPLGELIRV